MRAPLRAMQGFASILRQEDGHHLSPDGHLCISRIIAASDRMDRLIKDVLDYSSVVRSGLPLAPVQIEPLLRGILDFDPNLQPPHADISIVGPFPRLQANEAALTQCISHLLTNAVKFVALGVAPRVRVWAETQGQRARLFIKDNGIGIEPELQDRIFHIFQQLTKDTAGTGIGLAIVKKAMHRMNGDVGVQSEPGKGSTFWLDLPLT
jgi:signal transduction histidine kinase